MKHKILLVEDDRSLGESIKALLEEADYNVFLADDFYAAENYIYKDFKKPTEKKLEFLDYADTMKYLEDGTFAEGSMAPKIRACLRFVKAGGQKSVITEATKLEDRRYGSKITMEYEDDRR